MLILDKFGTILNNLEKSYSEMKDKLNVSTRNEFLRKLCFDSNGVSIIPTIKMAMLKEMNSYNDEQKNLHSLVVEILDSISFILSSGTIDIDRDEITDLNSLILLSVKEKSDSLVDKALTVEDLIDSFSFSSEILRMTAKEMFKSYGEVDSFSKMHRGKVVTVQLKQNLDDDFIAISPSSLRSMATMLINGELSENNKIVEKSINFLSSLNRSVGKLGMCAVCDKDLYKDGKILGRSVKRIKDVNAVSYKDCTIYLV